MSRRVRTALLAFAAVCLVAGVAYALSPKGVAAPNFTLTDQDARPYALSTERGRAVALLFGYTHCPDVCPTTLAALARAERKMPSGQGFDVVFVTVDPRRDTPAVLKRYLHLFDPAFVGLTGSAAELAPVYAAYHVYHQDLPGDGSAGGYAVAHSSTIYFIGPGGTIRGTGDWSDSPDELAAAAKKALS